MLEILDKPRDSTVALAEFCSPPKLASTSHQRVLVKQDVDEPEPKNWYPHKITRFDNMGECHLKALCSAMNPVVLSTFALGALKKGPALDTA